MKSTINDDQLDTIIGQILAEVSASVGQVSGESLAQAGKLMEVAPRIFVAGAGRTGFCMRALAMRLMHLGKIVHVVGETTTPSITAEDLLILGSRSGKTASLLAMAEQAQQCGAEILLFTAEATSPLADLADQQVVIPTAALEDAKGEYGLISLQPMGTLFEQALLILCDSLILEMIRRIGVDTTQMLERHANLE